MSFSPLGFGILLIKACLSISLLGLMLIFLGVLLSLMEGRQIDLIKTFLLTASFVSVSAMFLALLNYLAGSN